MTDAIADAERELEALGGHNHGPRADPFNPCIACAYMAAARKLALVVAEGASGQTCSCGEPSPSARTIRRSTLTSSVVPSLSPRSYRWC